MCPWAASPGTGCLLPRDVRWGSLLGSSISFYYCVKCLRPLGRMQECGALLAKCPVAAHLSVCGWCQPSLHQRKLPTFHEDSGTKCYQGLWCLIRWRLPPGLHVPDLMLIHTTIFFLKNHEEIGPLWKFPRSQHVSLHKTIPRSKELRPMRGNRRKLAWVSLERWLNPP